MSKKKINVRKFIIKNSMWSSLKEQTLKSKIFHSLRCTFILKDLTLLPLYALYFHSLSVSYKQDLMKSSLASEKTGQGLRQSLTHAMEHRTLLNEVYFSYGFFLTSSASLPSSWDFFILSEPWTIPSQLSIIASIHFVPFWSNLFWQLPHKVFASWTQAIQGALFFFSVMLPVLRSYLKTVSPWHTL